MTADTQKVQSLVDAVSDIIVEETEGSSTSQLEVVSALLLVLGRILKTLSKQPPTPAKVHLVTTINQSLLSLMIDGGVH